MIVRRLRRTRGRRLEPLLECRDYAIIFAGMFGDEAARELGYRTLGLPPRAGFEIGLGVEAAAAGAS